MGRRVQRFRAGGDGGVWWNDEGSLTFGLEITGRWWRRLIMRFHVFVITVRVEHHLVPKDFVISGEITAVTLAFGERAREHIEVEMVEATEPVFICAGRS